MPVLRYENRRFQEIGNLECSSTESVISRKSFRDTLNENGNVLILPFENINYCFDDEDILRILDTRRHPYLQRNLNNDEVNILTEFMNTEVQPAAPRLRARVEAEEHTVTGFVIPPAPRLNALVGDPLEEIPHPIRRRRIPLNMRRRSSHRRPLYRIQPQHSSEDELELIRPVTPPLRIRENRNPYFYESEEEQVVPRYYE
jgi:hypothetical protein